MKGQIDLLSVNEVTKKQTFSQLSFEFEKGILGVLSASDKEKADFSALITGNLFPDGGKITGNEKAVFVAKNSPIPDTLTVKEYFDFVRRISGKTEIPPKAEEILSACGEKLIRSLDDLTRSFAAICAALIPCPDYLVADDPAGKLDEEDKSKVFELLLEISETVPVIITSSSVEDCQTVCTHLLVLGKGRGLAYGFSDEVISQVHRPYELYLRIKGTEEKIAAAEDLLGKTATPTDKANVYEMILSGVSPDDPNALAEIKKKIRSSGVALLTFRPENEELRALFGYLISKDAENKAKAEAEKPQELKKITGSLLAFSHDADEDAFSSEDKNEEEDPDKDDGESTLFSSGE